MRCRIRIEPDLSTPAGRAALPERTKLVFLETPTNPFLKTVPIHEVATRVRSKNPDALVVVDNT